MRDSGATMALMHSTPNYMRACWHCNAYDGLTAQGTAALCKRPGGTRVQASPESGCAFWERKPGTDDEPGPPAGRSISTPWTAADSTGAGRAVVTPPVEWAP